MTATPQWPWLATTSGESLTKQETAVLHKALGFKDGQVANKQNHIWLSSRTTDFSGQVRALAARGLMDGRAAGCGVACYFVTQRGFAALGLAPAYFSQAAANDLKRAMRLRAWMRRFFDKVRRWGADDE